MVYDKLNITDLYMKEAANHKLLSREEEYKLAVANQKGCQNAREEMLKHNQRLVVNQATRFQYFGIPLLDLIQEGNLGLMKALLKFDPELGYKFSTYATWWIRHQIERAIANQKRSVRLPVHVEERLRKVKKVAEEIQIEKSREATDEEIATRLKVSVKRIRALKKYSLPALSLDTPLSDEANSHTIGDLIGQADKDDVIHQELDQALQNALSALTPRQAKIIRLRFGLNDSHPHTLGEVGAKFGLTRERIRQIEKEAMRRLSHPSRKRALQAYLMTSNPHHEER